MIRGSVNRRSAGLCHSFGGGRVAKPTPARVAALAGVAVLACAGGCAGEGSDIGPRLPRLPDASSRVLVLDDQNRGVVSAAVSIVGTNLRAATGRNGRADFLSSPSGTVLLDVDGSVGAAVSGDDLARLTVAMPVVGGDLQSPVHLPNLPASTAQTVLAGIQPSATTVTSTGGSTLTIAAGLSVGAPDDAAQVELRLGELSSRNLPGELPRGSVTGLLFGRGVYVSPPDVRFSPGVDLSVPDDLQLGGERARLYYLDPTTGTWDPVAFPPAGTTSVVGVITRGGLYAFGADVPVASVAGRIVNSATDTRQNVGEATVRVDGRVATTASDGTFVVDDVPTRFGDGLPRDTVVEVFAGGSWLPAVASAPVAFEALSGGFEPLGDVVLDTVPCGNIRVQQVVRARADPLQPVRLSSLAGDVALVSFGDAEGQVLFEDVPAGFFGYQEGRRRSRLEALYGQSVAFQPAGNRWLDAFQFLFQRRWFQGSRTSRAYVCDAVGGGPIAGAVLVQGERSGEGFVGETRENGTLFGERAYEQRGTVTLKTERDSRSITHAVSIELADSDQFEFPMQRVLRSPLGAFDRHGVLEGELLGVDPSREHAIRSTRRLALQEWWDELVDGVSLPSALPVDVDPATTHGPFRVGVAVPGGHVAAMEFTSAGGVDTLQSVGLLRNLEPEEAAVTERDIVLEFAADTTFTVVGGAATTEPAIVPADFELALALELPAGPAVGGNEPVPLIVDVARDLDGSLALVGQNLQLTLPALTGSLQDHAWLALLQGSTESAGVTSSHASLLRLADTSVPVGAFRLPELPTLTSPAAGSTVAAQGLQVGFSLPANAVGGVLELRSETASDLLLWDVFVRPDQPDFAFLELPTEAENPLVAGRTYTLTVTAWFGDIDIDSPDSFGDFVAYRQTIDLIEAGVRQISRRSITFSTN
ncbi:MAG: hypothetical protein AB8H80_11045 [Planctomycetota bacterium]